jgi:phenylacetate-CoA ligase
MKTSEIEKAPVINIKEWRNLLKERFNHSVGTRYQSSGTTGDNFSIVYSDKVHNGASQRAYKLLQSTPISPKDKVAIFFGFGIFPPADFYSSALLDMQCQIVKLGSGRNLETCKKCKWFEDTDIKAIISMPSYLLKFIDEIKKSDQKDLIINNIKCIIVGGEVLKNEVRNIIESFFNTKVYDHYGMLESPMIAGECKYGNIHFADEFYPEVLINGEITKKGTGKLLLSGLNIWEDNPMLRYETGDLVELSDVKCRCKNRNKTVKILGRSNNYIRFGSCLIDLTAIDIILNRENIWKYYFVMKEDADRKVILSLYIDCDLSINIIRKLLSDNITMAYEVVVDKKIILPHNANGKILHFLDKRVNITKSETVEV